MTLLNATLVLGGAASGKSAFAEKLVKTTGKEQIYIASAQVWDPEMHDKIDRHKVSRGAGWTTIEAPLAVDEILAKRTSDQVVLFDCATLWLKNHVMEKSDLEAKVHGLLDAVAACPAPMVIVSNELGHGIVPDNAMARAFRDQHGRMNQRIAEACDLVVMVTAGLPQVLKGTLPEAAQ